MDSTSATSKRLFVIYFPDGYLGVAPTVCGFLGELTAAGHYVHVRGSATAYPSAGTLPESSHVVTLARLFDTPRGAWFRRGLRKIKLLPFLELAWFAYQNFQLDRDVPLAQRRLRRVNIGIDLQGTVLAWCHALYARSSYVSVSLELPSANYRWFEKLVSWLERSSLRNAAALVIQDADRLQALEAYRSPLPSRVLLPPELVGAAPLARDTSVSG